MLGIPYKVHLTIKHESNRKLQEIAESRQTTVDEIIDGVIDSAYKDMLSQKRTMKLMGMRPRSQGGPFYVIPSGTEEPEDDWKSEKPEIEEMPDLIEEMPEPIVEIKEVKKNGRRSRNKITKDSKRKTSTTTRDTRK